jgi:hypothetical protein
MKTWAKFILCDNAGHVYEVRTRDHACRIEIKDGKVTRYWHENPIPLTAAVEAVNEYRRAQYDDYRTWAAKNGLNADLPIVLVSA